MAEQLNIAHQILQETEQWQKRRKDTIARLCSIASSVWFLHIVVQSACIFGGVFYIIGGAVMIGMGPMISEKDPFKRNALEGPIKEFGFVPDYCSWGDGLCLLTSQVATYFIYRLIVTNKNSAIAILKEDKKRTKSLRNLITNFHGACEEQLTYGTTVNNKTSQQLMARYLSDAMGNTSSSRSSRGETIPFGFNSLGWQIQSSDGTGDMALASVEAVYDAVDRSHSIYIGTFTARFVVSGSVVVAICIVLFKTDDIFKIFKEPNALNIFTLIFTGSSLYTKFVLLIVESLIYAVAALSIGLGIVALYYAISQITHCVASSKLQSAAWKLRDQLDDVTEDLEEYRRSANAE